jgi:hypothetical protein
MRTQQMWLVAQLSPRRMVTRVEVVVGSGAVAFIDERPRRQLNIGTDVFNTFDEARDASIRYYSNEIKALRYLRDAVAEQQDTSCLSNDDTTVQTESGFIALQTPKPGKPA